MNKEFKVNIIIIILIISLKSQTHLFLVTCKLCNTVYSFSARWMDPTKKYVESTTSRTTNISSSKKEELYPIIRAQKTTTKYGPTFLLTIRDSEFSVVQISLPKRYCAAILDDDMDKINNSAISLNLVYKCICETFKSYLLAIA